MKKFLTLIFAVAMTATVVSAQVVPGMKYKELKDIYNTKNYVKSANDPYSPGWSGVASFVLPGLGQIISGETGRGLGILAGDVVIGGAWYFCANKLMSYVEKDASGKPVTDANGQAVLTDKKAASAWVGGLVGVCVVGLAYEIWNICDAVKVAKIKNMYYQDLSGRHTMDVKLYPSLNYAMTATGTQPVTGMALSLRF